MKRQTIQALLLAAGLALSLAACGAQPAEPTQEAAEAVAETAEDTGTEEAPAALPATEDEAVAQALLAQARSGYAQGECPAEGHAILGTETGEDGSTVVYAQCSVGNYGFVNGNFEQVSGSGVIPSRLTFAKGEDGSLTLTDYWEAEDGSRYEPSIKETFPEELVDLALDTEFYTNDLFAAKRVYAETYLAEIGREAEIGDYADFDHPLATDAGMSVEVSNALLEEMWNYPFFLGNEERIEDGVRWVYSSEWEHVEDGGTATYTKTNFDTGEVAERHVFQVTGDTYTEVTEAQS